MKVLLTGTTGFIGRHLLDASIVRWGVENLTVLSSRPSVSGKSIMYHSDFTLDDSRTAQLENTELLIHAGAFTPKSSSTSNDITGCNGNVSFTGMLLGLPMPKLRKVVFLSTLDVYEPACAPLNEESSVKPVSLYGWSKLYCEKMVHHYSVQRGISSNVLRIGHVYGPGEEQYAKFLPNAIRNIVAGEAVELWGKGDELRSLIYVDDVVRAILAAAEVAEAPDVINVAGSQALPVRTLLEKAVALSGQNIPFVFRDVNHRPRDYVFDTRKLKQYLLPEETPLDVGLQAELAYMERVFSA